MRGNARYWVLVVFFLIVALGAAARLHGQIQTGIATMFVLFAAGFGAGASLVRALKRI